MKRIVFLLYAYFLVDAAVAQTTFPKEGVSKQNANYQLYTNAFLHIAPGIFEEGDMLVHEGKIVEIGNSAERTIPANTVVYDLEGLHVYPSFLEISSDYGLPEVQKSTKKNGPNTERGTNVSTHWNEAFHPEVDAVRHFSPDTESADQFLKTGFGLALVHTRDGIARGTSALVLLGGGKANEMVVQPQAAMHFSFDKGKSGQDYPSSLMGSIALIRQAMYDVNWYGSGNADESNTSLESLAGDRNLPWIFSIDQAEDALRVQRIAEEFDLNFSINGGTDIYKTLPSIGASIKSIAAPITLPKPFDVDDPELSRLISQSDLLHWERAPFNARWISESEHPLILSSQGSEKPETLFADLRKLIKKGLHPDSALAALTTNPARLLGAKHIGKLEKGYMANFFCADKDLFRQNDGKVLKHIIKGKIEYESRPVEKNFKGRYDLNINDVYYELELKKPLPEHGTVFLITDGDTLKEKAGFSSQGSEVTLNFENLEGNGYFRLSATVLADNRIWDGRGIDPEGIQVKWSAIRQREKPKQVSDTTTASIDSIPDFPPMLYPLKAYGSDSLPEASTFLIENATIWTCDSTGVLNQGSVLVDKGKILAVGKTINLKNYVTKAAVEVIDGTGMHITPGIVDEHSHIAITRGVNEGTHSNTAEVRIADALAPYDINIYRQLAGGVTTAQLLHGSANPIGGQSAIIKMRWGQDMDGLLFEEAPGFIKFALGENVKQSNWGDEYNKRYPQTRMGVEQFMYNELLRAKEYGEVKRIKSKSKKKKNQRKPGKEEPFRKDLQLEALLEVLNSERFVTCHSYVQSEINMLMHLADSLDFTLNTFTHILEGYKLADKMKEHGAAASTFSDWWAYKYEVKDAIPHNASILNRMGVLTAINSDDAEMGRRLNQEAAKAILYGGMSEEDALKLVTLNPAKILHIDEFTGSLTPGKDADIVIWTDHPLSVYAKAEKTYVDGILYFDRAEMEKRRKRDLRKRAEIINDMKAEAAGGKSTRKPKREMERYYHCDTKD